jgi:threonyl-tRNA synthetase
MSILSNADHSAVSESEINITFPDGSMRPVASGITGLALATSISPSLAKQALVIEIDGVLQDLDTVLTADCTDYHTKRRRSP